MNETTQSKVTLNFVNMITSTFEVLVPEYEFINQKANFNLSPEEVFRNEARRAFMQALNEQKIDAVTMIMNNEAEVSLDLLVFTMNDHCNGSRSIYVSACLKFPMHILNL